MGVELWIEDGDPCYLSPDIWTVPGGDPYGSLGSPVLNNPAYLWARIHNKGDSTVEKAQVQYYWANPSTVINRNSAVLVGISFVSLQPGETKEVLCLTPWIPDWINEGHMCLFVEVFSSEDPISGYTPDSPFYVCDDRHVAMRNVTVISSNSLVVFPFGIRNFEHFHSENTILKVNPASRELFDKMKSQLGLREKYSMRNWNFGLHKYTYGIQIKTDTLPHMEKTIELKLKAGRQKGFALIVDVPDGIHLNDYAMYLIEQYVGKQLIGGIGVIVTSQDGHKMVSSKKLN